MRAGLLFIESYRELPCSPGHGFSSTRSSSSKSSWCCGGRGTRAWVERTIGRRMGTGGSAGVDYLDQTARYRIFTELWAVRTLLLPRHAAAGAAQRHGLRFRALKGRRMTAIAFLVLGQMGAPMAARFAAAGRELRVWNRSPQAAAPLVAAGARLAAHPAAAVRGAGAVFTMLATPEALEAVVFGEQGIAAGIEAGTDFIEMSTVGVRAIRSLAARLPPASRCSTRRCWAACRRRPTARSRFSWRGAGGVRTLPARPRSSGGAALVRKIGQRCGHEARRQLDAWRAHDDARRGVGARRRLAARSRCRARRAGGVAHRPSPCAASAS
jgi:hypothetical protein